MDTIEKLFANNRAWAASMVARDPEYFRKLAAHQAPRYLWLGCSDSRVPSTKVVGLDPGEIFVHRNIANVVVHTDLNFLSVMQYAVEVLGVEHIIVCGHDHCGGCHAAMDAADRGLINNWLRHLRDIYLKHREELDAIAEEEDRLTRFAELNVLEQVTNVCHTTIVQRAWARGQKLLVHGIFYSLDTGLLRDLAISVDSPEAISMIHRMPAPRR